MKKILILIVILVLCISAVFFWWALNNTPVDQHSKVQKIFVVSAHENVRDIAYQLKKQDLIKSPIIFFLTVRQLGLDGKIQAGDFRLSPSMTTTQVAEALTHGTLDIWVTIPEGKRATEIAEILQQKVPTYSDSWKQNLSTQEGYLFPDTYLIPNDASISLIESLLTNNFAQKYQQAVATQTAKLTKEQIVIIASIIEREAKFPQDRPLVGSVLENRLQLGMPLQVDASVQYMLGFQPSENNWWKKSLSAEDLKIPSSYNTYLNPGLPPTPISSPGLASLTAAANPADTNYLYYVSDSAGHLHFATTLTEHNANIRKYTQ